MRKSFEAILDDGIRNGNWEDDSKLMLLLNYLESHCPDKLEHFETFIKAVTETEASNLSVAL